MIWPLDVGFWVDVLCGSLLVMLMTGSNGENV
jgi:hypothetical protein